MVHFRGRRSAATDFFKASMMLTTLLGGDDVVDDLDLALDGFFIAFFLAAMMSTRRSCTGSSTMLGLQSFVSFFINRCTSGIISGSALASLVVVKYVSSPRTSSP